MPNNRIRDNHVKSPNTILQNEHQDSADAKRVVFVDEQGTFAGTVQNPISVRLSDGSINIETLNAQLEVHLSHQDIGDDPADSVRVGDGDEEWQMNASGEGLVHDQDTHDKLDQLNSTLQTESDEIQETLEEISATLVSEFEETQNILQSEFDETQVKLDTLTTTLQTESDEIQQTLDTISNTLVSEFDETQVKLDTLTSTLQSESDATQILLQTEFDATQTLLQTEFDQTKTAINDLKTEVDASNYTMNEAFDKAQAIAGQLDDSGPVAATEGNIAPARITPQRALHVNLRDQLGVEMYGRRIDSQSIPVVQSENQTYSASASAFTPPANPQDVYTLLGSATKTIRIHKIRVTGSTTSGTGVKVTFNLIKRSTVNTGGTRVASTIVPHDSTNAAGTANAGHYTANATAFGTSVGILRSIHTAFTQTGLTGGTSGVEWDFETMGQPIYLRGANESISINLGGTAIAGAIMSISIEWSEI